MGLDCLIFIRKLEMPWKELLKAYMETEINPIPDQGIFTPRPIGEKRSASLKMSQILTKMICLQQEFTCRIYVLCYVPKFNLIFSAALNFGNGTKYKIR